MSDFEELKREAAQTFGNIVRASSASEVLNAQQMMMVMAQLVADLEVGQTLDLTELELFLRNEKQLEPSKVEEILVFFQSRQAKIGFPISLPLSMGALSEERRQLIVEGFKKKPKTDTYSGGGRETSAGSGPSKRQETVFDRKRPGKKKQGPNRRLVITAAITIVLGGVYFAITLSGERKKHVEIEVPADAAALPCTRLVLTGSFAGCLIDGKLFNSYTPEEQVSRRDALLDALASKGVRNILITDDKDGKPYPL